MSPAGTSMLTAIIIIVALCILIGYLVLYRIPKALIKYAIRTYFDEKWNMEHRNQQNPQIRY